MKCLTLHSVKSPLVLEERPDLAPDPGQVVVELKAAALNRRDFWVTQGMYPGMKLPCIPGSDGAGVVTRCGADVDPAWLHREVIIDPGLEWGDTPEAQQAEFRVLGMPEDGTFATEIHIPAAQLYDRPQHLDWNESAALPLGGVTAWRAVMTQGQLTADDKVLITGIGGGVATFALQFAVAAGAQVWVTSSSEKKIEQAVALGASGGFNYTQPDWWKHMSKDVGAPSLIVDSAGGPSYAALLSLAAPGGRIVNYGSTVGMPEKLDLFKVFWKQLRLVGSTMGSPQDFRQMLDFVNQHQIRPVVDSIRPLAEGDTAVSAMAKSPQFGKFVLTCE